MDHIYKTTLTNMFAANTIRFPSKQNFDLDAVNWISAVETADGQTLEADVRLAMNQLVKDLKSNSIWDTISVLAVMCGARTLAGSIINVKSPSTSLTNTNFVAGDYDRITGLLGDGTTKYLDSGVNCNSVGQDDCALWVSIHTEATGINDFYCGAGNGNTGSTCIRHGGSSTPTHFSRNNTGNTQTSGSLGNLTGNSRTTSLTYTSRGNSTDVTQTKTSQTPYNNNIFVFATNAGGTPAVHADCRLRMFGFGKAHTLSTTEAIITTFKNSIHLALNLLTEEITDSDSVAWISAVETADSQALEHNVKLAMNQLVKDLKSNSIWDTISVLDVMCGARTLAGSIINAKSPSTSLTNTNFVSGDYNRSTGLLGDGTTKYLDSGVNCNSVGQDDCALWVSIHTEATGINDYYCGAGNGSVGGTAIRHGSTTTPTHFSRANVGNTQTSGENGTLTGQSRSNSATFTTRGNSADATQTRPSGTPYNGNIFVFATNVGGTATLISDGRLRMFCFGSAHTLSTTQSIIDTHIGLIEACAL